MLNGWPTFHGSIITTRSMGVALVPRFLKSRFAMIEALRAVGNKPPFKLENAPRDSALFSQSLQEKLMNSFGHPSNGKDIYVQKIPDMIDWRSPQRSVQQL